MGERKINGGIYKNVDGSYTGSKKELRAMVKKAQMKTATRVGAIALAAGMAIGTTGTTVISSVAGSYNNSKNAKEAVEIANNFEKYMKNFQMTQNTDQLQKMQDLEKLEEAVQTFERLQNKKDKTIDEQESYMEAGKTICKLKEVVINTYTDTIISKVAEAYGITNEEEIQKIEVTDHVRLDGSGPNHNQLIQIPGFENVKAPAILGGNGRMDEGLAIKIAEARKLKDTDYSFEDMTIEELPVEKIITVYKHSLEFNKNYNITKDDKGNLKLQEVEQTKETPEKEER